MPAEQLSMAPSSAPADGKDRATYILQAHFQEWSPANITHSRAAFDEVLDPEVLPWQTKQRIDVAKRVKVNLRDFDGRECMVMLVHNPIAIPKGAQSDALSKAQAVNEIRITNEEGVLLSVIRNNCASLNQFGFKEIYAASTATTAFLTITAFPIPKAGENG